MSERRTLRFEIEGYDPSTMPLDQLLGYLEPLVDLLGTNDLHLVGVDEGSTVPLIEHDDPSVEARLTAIARGTADPRAAKAQAALNERLGRFGTTARLRDGDGATILRFPGTTGLASETEVTIREAGHQDGLVVNIGGAKDIVPLRLETFDGRSLSGFKARRDVAKPLAQYLFEPVRLFGQGVWTRQETGWHLDRFDIDRFAPLPKVEAIPDRVQALRRSGAQFSDDAVERALRDRLDESA